MNVHLNSELLVQEIKSAYNTLFKLLYKVQFNGENYILLNRKDEIVAITESERDMSFYVLGFISGINNAMDAIAESTDAKYNAEFKGDINE